MVSPKPDVLRSARSARSRRSPRDRRLGVEHEYRLLRGSEVVDARQLIPTLPLDGSLLDPGDPLAVRGEWGGVITADGMEAEIVTPPCRLGVDSLRRVVDAAATGHAVLTSALPADVCLQGYSTHLNVEVTDKACRSTALLVARRFAPALMLFDRQDSPGLLIRPRHRRLELGYDHIDGEALHAALVLAIGAAAMCERAARSRAARRVLPPELRLHVVPSPQRYGWYVDRRAGGQDLYECGRATVFQTISGSSITAQELLEEVWTCARAALDALLPHADVALVDEMVEGRHPLRSEVTTVEPYVVAANPRVEYAPSVLARRDRGEVVLTTVAATWHALVLRAERGADVRWIRVPGEHVDDFLRSVDSGHIDAWLAGQFGRTIMRGGMA